MGGNTLIFAGVIVLIVGLTIALVRTLHLPSHWIPVGVGVALIVVGLLRRGRRF
jgi:hypothetical protein